MSDEVKAAAAPVSNDTLVRSIDWKQGLIIAMGIPILIVPSLCDLSVNLWAMSIAIWVLSVLSGFLLNIPLGEMCATFGVAGIGGSIQHIFRDDEKYKGRKVNYGRMIGSLGAWAYFATWVPVIPIFTIMTGVYINDYFELGFSGSSNTLFYLLLGVLIYGFIIITGRKGLEGGAKAQLILAAITIVPILIIVMVPLFTGDFHMNNITDEVVPVGWKWDGNAILMILGCFTVAQWSAVGWESAATYGAEYKEPSKDVPKALMSCGLLCLFMYFVIAFCMYGALGISGINAAGAATLIPIAESDFGNIGGAVAVVLLIAGMVMIIQTAFLGTARTIQIMAKDGNFPYMFSKTNIYGVPMYAMFFEAAIGFIIILAGITASQILAVSALGFAIALGMCMLAFIKSRRDPRFKDVERVYRAPKWALPGAYFMCIFEFFFMIPGLLYYVYDSMGFGYVIIGICATLLYVPCWIVIQWWNTQKHPNMNTGVMFEKEENPQPKLMGIFAIVGAILLFTSFLASWVQVDLLWTHLFSGYQLLTGDSGDFQAFIPTVALVFGLAVMVLEILNFLKPRGSSKAFTAAALVLSVAALALCAVFCMWDIFGGAVKVADGVYIGMAGAAISTVFTAVQVMGVSGHPISVGRKVAE
ncbi:Dimethylamine permease [Candidatus Methanomethylophilus alvi Mx1201]|uniref:Dimethylamine permease n=2 Tax=Methanomethylophilus alvi TaxID=1291540 RepID=M9SA65_METAX|nr:APC family permease [Methanomethylophilus alvi]AGI85246.1 Dimethylamine permease [Candidatus Methanomethylophilus alvi Mx1201]AYQ54671.1 amino acid transporter [Methanomethylophilus alvi]